MVLKHSGFSAPKLSFHILTGPYLIDKIPDIFGLVQLKALQWCLKCGNKPKKHIEVKLTGLSRELPSTQTEET